MIVFLGRSIIVVLHNAIILVIMFIVDQNRHDNGCCNSGDRDDNKD